MKNSKNQFRINEQALINDILTNGKQGRTWGELAIQYNIRPHVDLERRRKSANDVWRRFNKLQGNVDFTPSSPVIPLQVGGCAVPLGITPQWQMPHYFDTTTILGPVRTPPTPTILKPKRLFYDIETSYNIVKSWRVGYNININPDDIIHERAIITIAYKWEGDENVTVLSWDNGDDEKVVKEFVKLMGEADELVGHNIDKFDTKFIMSRALKHGIMALPKYQSTDTLKLSRKHFMLNSNKLDYIAQYLGIGSKLKHRGMSMWDDIILRNDPKALEEMIEYNVQDVLLTEQVYNKLRTYAQPSISHATISGHDSHTCPDCGKTEATLVKTYVTKAGTKSRLMQCSCGVNYTITNKKYEDHYATK